MTILAYVLHIGVFPVTADVAYRMLYEMTVECAAMWGFIIVGLVRRIN